MRARKSRHCCYSAKKPALVRVLERMKLNVERMRLNGVTVEDIVLPTSPNYIGLQSTRATQGGRHRVLHHIVLKKGAMCK